MSCNRYYTDKFTNFTQEENYNILIDKLKGYLNYETEFNNRLNDNYLFNNNNNNDNNDNIKKYNDILIEKLPINVSDEYICPTINNEPSNCMFPDNIYNSKLAYDIHLDKDLHLFIPYSSDRSWFGRNGRRS